MDRPLPVIDDTNRYYWEAAREHRLVMLRCSACGTWVHPPPRRVPVVPVGSARTRGAQRSRTRVQLVGDELAGEPRLRGRDPVRGAGRRAGGAAPACSPSATSSTARSPSIEIGHAARGHVRAAHRRDHVAAVAPCAVRDASADDANDERVPRPGRDRRRRPHPAARRTSGSRRTSSRCRTCLEAIADAGLEPGDIDGIAAMGGDGEPSTLQMMEMLGLPASTGTAAMLGGGVGPERRWPTPRWRCRPGCATPRSPIAP